MSDNTQDDLDVAVKRLAAVAGDACLVSYMMTVRGDGRRTFRYRAMIETGDVPEYPDLAMCIVEDGTTANDAVDKALAKFAKETANSE